MPAFTWSNIKAALRWYLSPYLTTLITAPMLIVLGWFAAVFAYRATLATLYTVFRPVNMPLIVPAMVAPMNVMGLVAVVAGFMGLPVIWNRPGRDRVSRLAAVAAAFLGIVLLVLVWEVVLLFIVDWLGRIF